MLKSIKGHHVGTTFINSGTHYYSYCLWYFDFPSRQPTHNETLVHKYTWNLSYTSTEVEVWHLRLSRKRQFARGPANDTSHAKKKTYVSASPYLINDEYAMYDIRW